jgi:guanylate kinase
VTGGRARILVLSAPSGGGKTTIARAVRDRQPDRYGFSVSATTRKPRPGERDGIDYHFWTRAQFDGGVAQGQFLEHATYAGELYGTLKGEVEKVLASGRHVLLDIEVDGAAQVKRIEQDAITIFILPSTPRVLIERLLQRRSESPAEIKQRLERAKYELREAARFDRFIRNDRLEDAVREVIAAVDEGGGYRRQEWELGWLDNFAAGLEAEAHRVYEELHQQKG